MERMITIDEFAESMGVSVRTVYGWNSTGAGPRYVRAGKHVRYRAVDIENWLNSLVVDRQGRAA